MRRTWGVAAGVTAVVAGLVLLGRLSGADEPKDLPIKVIMTKAHKGGDSLIGKLAVELRGDEPEWALIQKQTRELIELGTALSRATPPKGKKESWDRLTKAYVENAKEMNAAAQKKDQEPTSARLKTLTGMCAKCHGQHKGK
jgi:hypothetical protein